MKIDINNTVYGHPSSQEKFCVAYTKAREARKVLINLLDSGGCSMFATMDAVAEKSSLIHRIARDYKMKYIVYNYEEIPCVMEDDNGGKVLSFLRSIAVKLKKGGVR